MMKKAVWRPTAVLFSLLLIVTGFLTGCQFSDRNEKYLSNHNFPGVQAAAEGEGAGTALLQEDPLWSEEESLKAVVLSDLHYTEKQDQDHTLVPGIAEAERITDALLAEVIDRHPDVLIMTGDHTNTGYAEDVEALAAKLWKVKEQGICIVMTTGNHDFDQMGAAEYEKSYFPLFDPVDRDTASLSYTAIIKEVVFLVMDDHNEDIDWQGAFSPETMQWLRDMLEKYKDHTVVFLSHHNVLYGYEEDHPENHLIQNPDLPSLLQKSGVKLAMTGHMHFPYITEKDGLWEILSGMPFSGNHLIGNLAVGENRIIYYAEPANLAFYDSLAKEELDRLDQESFEYMEQIFSDLLTGEGLKAYKKKRVMNLISWYLYYYNAGTLAEHTQEFTQDPSYERMIKALWNHNYGPWMKAMIETTEYSARQLEITW